MEIWKNIEGYEDIYQVSNTGLIKSKYNNRWGCLDFYKIINPTINKYGYKVVTLCKGGKEIKKCIHLIIAEVFLNHKHKTGYVVDHIDNNPLNNDLSNLQIITIRENLSKDKKGKSKYTGVTFKKQTCKWCSTIYIDGKNIHLGYFNSEIDANLAYKNKLKEINNVQV